VADYMPHTPEEIAEMLEFLGMASIDELFEAIPQALQLAGGLNLPRGKTEPDVRADFLDFAAKNAGAASRLVCFAGAGSYDHEIPPVVKALGSRSEFVTAYTPYQPEVAQGVLQAVFEFQTMVARLAGLPIANASLYDGAASLVEAVNLSAASANNPVVWISSGVHPHWRQVLAAFAEGTGHQVQEVPLVNGQANFEFMTGTPGVIVIANPTYLGTLDNVAGAKALAVTHGARLVVAADPITASLLKSPGSQGADVVIGEGQALGTPLSFGGPYLGLFACTDAELRRLPGRLVGETLDVDGTRAYVTTLRAREQDIRREKATSNVCSNQTLMAVWAAIQLGWLGTQGIREVAIRSIQATRYLRDELVKIDGVSALTGQSSVTRDAGIVLPIEANVAIERLAGDGFLAGVSVAALTGGGDRSIDAELVDNALLVAATEKRTRVEIDALVAAVGKVVR
jgi:glycine dehydrogenase subunit 1